MLYFYDGCPAKMSTISCYKHSELQSDNVLVYITASSLCISNTLFMVAAIAPRGASEEEEGEEITLHSCSIMRMLRLNGKRDAVRVGWEWPPRVK